MNIKLTVHWLSFIFLIVLGSGLLHSAMAQTTTSVSSDRKQDEIEHRVQIQILIASNILDAKNDYPQGLEPVVKQIKSLLPFKSHHLYATYFYNVADKGNLKVSDVTYKPYGNDGGLSATFFSLEALGVKLNTNGNSTHISKFRFEERKNIFLGRERANNNEIKTIADTIGTGIDTELNVKEGVPTIVGTTTSGLSDGVLIIVITLTHSKM